jgi:hypothetical protein
MKRMTLPGLIGIAALLAACSNGGGELKENQPPTVWLSAGPPEGSTSKYRVDMYWGGWDPDGEIAGYEYLITENEGSFNPADTVGVPWSPVAGNDSTFVFSADQPVDTLNASEQVAQFQRSHTFFIRAIDREGLRSARPAHRSFTAFTLSPRVVVDVPKRNALNPAEVPPISTFRWRAFDYVVDNLVIQQPDSVQWALKSTKDFGGLFPPTINYLRDYERSKDDWYPWVWYGAPSDSGKFWTTPPIDIGTYVFAIRAKDEAGAITPVLDEEDNVRRVSVNERSSGPIMTVTNEYLGVIRWASCTASLNILDSPAGVPLEFKVIADASSYGGTEAGYRYGWDIPDLNDPEQWETDLTPFLPGTRNATIPARTYYYGTHTLTMEVVDNSGYCTRIAVKVNIVQFTLDRNLLIVDDDINDDQPASGWANGGLSPNDQEHDQFWKDMVSEVSGFDPDIDMVDTKLQYLPLTLLAQYKSIIWTVHGDRTQQRGLPLIYSFIAHRQKNPPENLQSTGGKVSPNILALAMAAGSHVMIAGKHPVQNVINRSNSGDLGLRFPLIWVYELEGAQKFDNPPEPGDPLIGDLSFAFRELCLETMDFAVIDVNTITRRSSGNNRQYCPTQAARPKNGTATSARDDGMRSAYPIDPTFPTLTLRPEAAGPGKWYAPSLRGVDCEIYNPFYFQRGSGQVGSCQYAEPPRSCFQPIYGLGSTDTTEPVYHQPIAFWTSAFADRVANVTGAVGARSIVFGFPPVFVNPSEFQQVMNKVLFDEWKMPRGAGAASAVAGAAASGATPE